MLPNFFEDGELDPIIIPMIFEDDEEDEDDPLDDYDDLEDDKDEDDR